MRNHVLPIALLLGSLLTFRATAQTTAETQAHQQAITALYPVMLQALHDNNYAQARSLCQQAISWEPRNPVHRYNLGCIEARAGVPTAAFAALSQATRLGYSDVNTLRTDTDLASLRADARFAGLVQATARNAGPAAAAPVRPVAAQASVAKPAATPARPAGAVARAAGPSATSPLAGRVAGGKPVGLFFMTRYWMNSGLEKHVWYFTADGRVYVDPDKGFSAAELASHTGQRGTYQVAGTKLTVKWSDGSTSQNSIENPEATFFSWDGANFIAASPFANAGQLAGSYEGGEYVGGGGGGASVSKSVTLRPDGTFTRGSAGSVRATGQGTSVTGGGSGSDGGRWQLSGYFLTLTDNQGGVTRGITFPYDDKATATYPDRMFFNGTMYKRQ